MPQGHIVQEEQRLCPLRQHVVDAHRHGVYAYGVVLVQRERNLQLGAHAVGAAHQHRFLEAKGGEVEHTPEGAYSAHRALACGRCNMGLYSSDHFISGLQVHAGLFVSFSHISIRFLSVRRKVMWDILR